MIWSLLQQPLLAKAVTRYDWRGYDRSKVNEEMNHALREALERCRLPPGVAEEYYSLNTTEAVVQYVFDHTQTNSLLPLESNIATQNNAVPFRPEVQHSASMGHQSDSFMGSPQVAHGLSMGYAAGGKAYHSSTISDPDRQRGYSSARPDIATFPKELVNKHENYDTQSRPEPSRLRNEVMYLTECTEDQHNTSFRTEMHPPMVQHYDTSHEHQSSHTRSGSESRRRGGVSLRRSLSNLSLRMSPSKGITSYLDETPPVPAVPQALKVPDAAKPGNDTYHHENYGGRPMSGIEETWTSFLNDAQLDKHQ